MSRIKVKQEIRVYEIDSVDVTNDDRTIGVDSHWNRNSMVVLRVGVHSYIVVGADLKAAINNAMNSGGV